MNPRYDFTGQVALGQSPGCSCRGEVRVAGSPCEHRCAASFVGSGQLIGIVSSRPRPEADGANSAWR
jgi:hypothetical protein